jgi:DNA-binding NarL/FixJ family response regulator
VLFREGIHFTLSGEEDIDVIGEATDNEEALNSIEANPPRVAVLNSNRGKPSGIEVTRHIKQNLPSVSIVLTTDSDDEEQLFSAMKSGASAYVTKEVDPDELVSIIRKVAQGASPISEALVKPEIASRVIDEFEVSAVISKEAGDLLARLTPREGEILHHLAKENSIAQLTQTLSINEGAIRRHLEHILTKLVANDHNREVIAAAQSNLPEIISSAEPSNPAAEYITKDEFTEFKQSITERLKSLTGGAG